MNAQLEPFATVPLTSHQLGFLIAALLLLSQRLGQNPNHAAKPAVLWCAG
jgi:hypothetical protein